MYDELIKELRETSACFGELDSVSVMMLEAADAIEELIAALTASNEVIAKSKPRWIPVTERLPKDWRSVLVHCAAGEARWIQIADVVRGKWRLLPGYADAKVTHWMPLPEPPKEET